MLKPTQEWILVEVVEDENNVTESGIVLVRSQENTKRVKIVSFGPDSNKAGVLQEGDVVLCVKTHGLPIKHEENEYEFMKEENFLGLVE